MRLVSVIMLFLLLSLVVNCGGIPNDTSKPKYAVSKDGTKLVAKVGRYDRGLSTRIGSSETWDVTYQLLTKEGSISKKQLKKTLRFMGCPEHVFTMLVGTGSVVALTIATTGAIGAIGVIGAAGSTFGYRIIKGNIEGEKAAPIASQAIFSSVTPFLIGSPVVEYFQRRGRFTSVLSDKDQLEVTDRKMRKFIGRIRDTVPKYPRGCDHLKTIAERLHNQLVKQ